MVNGAVLLMLVVVASAQFEEQNRQVEELVAKWAPLVWLSPKEKFMPSSTEDFLNNVYIADENLKSVENSYTRRFSQSNSKLYYLVTQKPIELLKQENNSFLNGRKPNQHSVPVYAVVTYCTPYITFHSSDINNIGNDVSSAFIYGTSTSNPNLFFHVSYWMFYPYNEGKEVCFLGKVPSPLIFNTCFGHLKTMGNHVGDWEHMTLSFMGKSTPNKLYLAVHDAGVYYKYDEMRKTFKYESQVTRKGVVQVPKFPPIVRVQGGHPVLFSALGSHGLWSAPGEHTFVRVPRLTDVNDYGIPWKTWNNVLIYHLGISPLPDWMTFKGKWGNPKSGCLLFKKLGVCEYTDGPKGILRKKQDFYCRRY